MAEPLGAAIVEGPGSVATITRLMPVGVARFDPLREPRHGRARPVPATGVQILVPLPAGLTYASSNADDGSYDSTTGVWTGGNVPLGTPIVLHLVAQVASGDPSTVTASIAHADQADPQPAGNSVSVTVTPQLADLAVAVVVNQPTPNVGDAVIFTITLTNAGPDVATNVHIASALPSGSDLLSDVASAGGYDAGTGTWTVSELAAGTPITLQINATVASVSTSTLTATEVSLDQFDTVTANNSASTR